LYGDGRRLVYAINDRLPSDINILVVEEAPDRFHARHDAVSRSYLYQISSRRTAFGKKYVRWVKDRLEVGEMARAAELVVGVMISPHSASATQNETGNRRSSTSSPPKSQLLNI